MTERERIGRAIVLLSGGVDSTVLAYHLADQGAQLRCISFRYGQRHADRELAAARATAYRLHAHQTVSVLGTAMGSSALTGQGDVPSADTSDPTATAPVVVPARNLLFLASAVSQAVASGVKHIYFAAHADDADSFADCRASFLNALGSPLSLIAPGVSIIAPFIKWSKADIVRRGEELGVPWAETYSCYEGKAQRCDICGACRSRKAAFEAAGVEDVDRTHKFPTFVTLHPQRQ